MKILVADDHELFLTGLELVIKSRHPDAKIVLAHDYNGIFSIIEKQNDFDIILTDLAMPGAVWSKALKQIHQTLPETPIIILSALFDKEIVEQTIDMGVSGYLSKTSSHTEILQALDMVLSGAAYLPYQFLKEQKIQGDSITEKLLHGLLETQENQINTEGKHLTPRQTAVLEGIADGKANKQIAYELALTEGTVKLHVTAILKILGVYNRTAAVMEATKLGLIKKR